MTVSVNAPTKNECEAIISILDKTISSASSDVGLQYEHSIYKAQSAYHEAYNSRILDQQKAQNDSLIAIEKTMQQVSSAMTADQKEYYYALLNAVKEENNNGKSLDARAIAKEGLAEEENLIETAGSEASTSTASDKASESEQNVIMVPGKKISVKHILLGAFVGIFMAVCFWGIFYVLSPKLKTRDELNDVFGLTVLGIVKNDSKYNKGFGGVDRFIDSLFEKMTGDCLLLSGWI